MKALIIVDMQLDFMPGGRLPVPGGWDIAQAIRELALSGEFDVLVATQDWHPAGHFSFAPAGPYPEHCVQGTHGAALISWIETLPLELVQRKGLDPRVDSPSGFKDAKGRDSGLMGWLLERGVRETHYVGVARDICVRATALHAAKDGGSALKPTVRWELTAPVDATYDGADLKAAGVRII